MPPSSKSALKPKDPKRVRAGKRARTKGPAFERQIATDMRAIYDPPKLTAELAALKGDKSKQSEYRTLQKSSRVRRSDQGRGAKEADLVIKGCPCWLELQDATGHSYSPLTKLLQAERDVVEADSDLWPVSVCHQSGRRSIEVCMRLGTLMTLSGVPLEALSLEAVLIPAVIDYEHFKGMLGHYERR